MRTRVQKVNSFTIHGTFALSYNHHMFLNQLSRKFHIERMQSFVRNLCFVSDASLPTRRFCHILACFLFDSKESEVAIFLKYGSEVWPRLVTTGGILIFAQAFRAADVIRRCLLKVPQTVITGMLD